MNNGELLNLRKEIKRENCEELLQLSIDEVDIDNLCKQYSINELFIFIKRLKNEGKDDVIAQIQEKIDLKIKKDIEKEKKVVVNQGKRQVYAAGRFLNSVIDDPDIELDYILRMIELGANPNYICYKNSGSLPTYIPTLYKATQIPDDERRKTILRALLKAKVDVNTSYQSVDYNKEPPKKTILRALDVNNGELRTLISELGKENASNQDYSTPKSTIDVKQFLQNTVKLSQTQIDELSQTFKKFSRNLEKESIEELEMKKAILEACDSVSSGFTKYGTILFNSANVLYARLMFFHEQGIKIEPQKLHETMAANKKRFAEKYATKLGLSSDNPEEVKWAMLKKYPMPKDRKEFKKKLDELVQGRD